MAKELYKLVSVAALKPNPFRDMENYPIDEDRIAALLESYDRTEFWGNIVARRAGDSAMEIAYGHHRLIALQRKYGVRSKQEVGVIIRDLSDADMLRIMADENDENWKSSSYVNMEAVRAVLLAYADDKITLGKVPAKTNTSLLCEAPSVIPAGKDAVQSTVLHPYSHQQVAEFLGWIKKGEQGKPNYKCEVAFMCLEAVEVGLAQELDFVGMPITAAHTIMSKALAENERKTREAAAINKSAERKQREAESAEGRDRARLEKEAQILEQQAAAAEKEAIKGPKQFVNESKKDIKAGAGLREIREKAAARSDAAGTSRALKNWDAAASKIVEKLRKLWTADDPVCQAVLAIIDQSEELSSSVLKTFTKELNGVVQRVAKVVEKL